MGKSGNLIQDQLSTTNDRDTEENENWNRRKINVMMGEVNVSGECLICMQVQRVQFVLKEFSL
jgi:hypothetical protein